MQNKVKLYSIENHEFIVDWELAVHSSTLEVFLNPQNNFIQSKTRAIKLPITTKYLKRILEFMKYTTSQISGEERGEFVIAEDETNELLEMAAYLRI